MSRWEELTKQPTAKFIHIYNQTDQWDNKGKRILISPRRTPDFDHFVEEVNDKLAPPGVGLRNIYTAQGGSQVRSVSALTVSKDYTASPQKFDKKFLKKMSTVAERSRKNSKKSPPDTSDGYFSDGEFLKKKRSVPGRKSLMERQAEYARSRSPSPRAQSAGRPFTPSHARLGSRHASPQRKAPARSPVASTRNKNAGKTPPARRPIQSRSPPAKSKSSKAGKKSSFNRSRYNNPALAAAGDSDREATPPGKRRVAFRGQYLFITDDESEDDDYDGGKSLGKSKKTTKNNMSSKRSSIYSKASSTYSNGSDYSKVSKAKSKYAKSAQSSSTKGGDSDEYSYDSDDKSTYGKSKKSAAKSAAKSLAKSTARNSTYSDNKSRITEESDDYSYDESRQATAKTTKTTKTKPSAFRNSLSPSRAAGKSQRSTARSKASTKTAASKASSRGGASSKSSSRGGTSSKSAASNNSDYYSESDGSRAGSRVSKYSKFSKQAGQSKASSSDSGSYSDSSPDRGKTAGGKGASRRSSASGASTAAGYNARSGGRSARQVPDSAETKVNTPVDMKTAAEVSSNASNTDSYYSDSGSDYDKSRNKK